ncbi:MAG: NnrU family protein [Pseudomonadota bacterium]
MGWSEFVLALVALLLSHTIPVRAPVKLWLVARIGSHGFAAFYSALSLALLGWVIVAAVRAPTSRFGLGLLGRTGWQSQACWLQA